MPDVLAAPPVAGPPAPVAPVVPPPNTPPPAPQNEPVLVDKSPDTPVYYTGPDGKEVKATLAEAVAAHQKLQTVKIPDGFDPAKWDLFTRAYDKGDTAAIKQLMQTYYPDVPPSGQQPGQPAAPPPPNAREQEILDKMNKLEAMLSGKINPVIQGIMDNTQLQQIDGIVKNPQVTEKFPHLAKHPNAAQLIKGRLDNLKNSNPNANAQQMQQYLTTAFQEWETFLAQTATLYGQPAQHPAARLNYADDRRANTPQSEKPKYTLMPDGTIVDNYAAPGTGQPAPAAQTLPAQPILPPIGGSPGVGQTAKTDVPFTGDDLRRAMSARATLLQ